jgi:thiamine biosynthesis lipoprotein
MGHDSGLAVSEWALWSTTARLVVTEPGAADAARDLVDGYLAEVDAAANRFRDDSEIRTLARDADGSVLLSPLLRDLLTLALDAADFTNGDVDPTVGTALKRLGYDRTLELVSRDGTPVRAVVRPVPGWRTLRLAGSRLRMPDGIELDLGATAKAIAADNAAALVHAKLGVGALVSLGGDIATAGRAPAGGWQIHVQDRVGDPATQVALPAGGAIATSSTVNRRWQRGDRSVHHIVDPRTGQPAEPFWRSVTVAASSCVYANTVTTASVVRGRAAVPWVESLRLPARFLDRHGTVHLTSTWPRELAA